MNEINKKVTFDLLKSLMGIQSKINVLDQQGVKFLILEHIQMDLINTITSINGISKDHDKLDRLCDPIFKLLRNEMTIYKCLNELSARVRALERVHKEQVR